MRIREQLRQFVERYQLRYLKQIRRYMGIYRGICLSAWELNGIITFDFFSPSADVGDQVNQAFADFSHCEAGGLPTAWLQRRTLREGTVVRDGCWLSLDRTRLTDLGLQRLLDLPEWVAADLKSYGAGDELPCSSCNQFRATTLGLVDWDYMWYCDHCWQSIQLRVEHGSIPIWTFAKWEIAAPILAAFALVGSAGWGWLQQPGRLPNVEIHLLWLLPVGWGFAICAVLTRAGVTSNPALRVMIAVSVLFSVLAGNIWGYWAAIEQQFGQIELGHAIQTYFTVYLWHNFSSEFPFLIGGAVGAWLGFHYLKSTESIRVE